jgi:hypothetical protein
MADAIRWTEHAMLRLIKRGISRNDVKHALESGEIIEQYPDDYPYPSSLVLGVSDSDERFHIVCGYGENELWIITAYHPDLGEWTDDFRKRVAL